MFDFFYVKFSYVCDNHVLGIRLISNSTNELRNIHNFL